MPRPGHPAVHEHCRRHCPQGVVANGGQPNHNLGEAFLCVKPKLSTHDPTESERTEAETKMRDGALTAFAAACGGRCLGKLDKYGQNEEIQKMLGDYQTVIGYDCITAGRSRAQGTAIKIDCSTSRRTSTRRGFESATAAANILMSSTASSCRRVAGAASTSSA